MGKQNKYKGIFLNLFGSQGYFRSSKIVCPGLTAVVGNMTVTVVRGPALGGWDRLAVTHPRPSQHQDLIDAEDPDVRGGGA